MADALEKATRNLYEAMGRMHFPAVTWSLNVRDAKDEVRRQLIKREQARKTARRKAS